MARPRWWWGWCAVFGPGTIHKVKPMGLDARVHGWEEEGVNGGSRGHLLSRGRPWEKQPGSGPQVCFGAHPGRGWIKHPGEPAKRHQLDRGPRGCVVVLEPQAG